MYNGFESCVISLTHCLHKHLILQQLGEVEVEVETCEDLRDVGVQEDSSLKETGKYGFQHKVIDGMTVTVDRVVITFRSPAFVATVQVLNFSFSPFFLIYKFFARTSLSYPSRKGYNPMM